ncbi:Transmembrane protein 147 [Sciurus carolinensis]|uniref:BOS complex subunit TMEM147 n=1 Tax=Sciurus carolinensis TaxID=30640 RepID=A0AA41N7A2_SCICA|nr:Transmembrane protein 147 [Sciurus carolinensis]
MKANVDVADLIGLNLVMSRNAGKEQDHGCCLGLGHSRAHYIPRTPLRVGARGREFDWKCIQMSVDSCISLSIPWCPQAFVMETFVHLCSLGSWTALLARAVVTGLLALSTLALYVTIVNVHS